MRTFSLKDEIASFDGKRAITIEGNLTLTNCQAIKEELLAAIGMDSGVGIVVVKLAEIDLSGLQLLVALKATLWRSGKDVKFEIEYPSVLKDMVERSGFLAILQQNSPA
jgi:Anti-anti-sigma regulatory factor (antagonist of anti-sigma factor)